MMTTTTRRGPRTTHSCTKSRRSGGPTCGTRFFFGRRGFLPHMATPDVLRRVAQREEERAQRLEKSREEKGQEGAFDADAFSNDFQQKRAAIAALLQSNAREGDVTAAVAAHRGLQQQLNDASEALAQRECRRFAQELQELFCEIEAAKSRVQPKKKFAFSRAPEVKKDPPHTVESGSSNSIAIAPTPTVGAPASLAPSHPEGRIADRQDELIVVDLRSTVFLHSLVRCTILVRNPLAGSCFVTACRHCVFVLQAQQLRIHETIDSHFYVSCGSVPIIENCTRLLFAPHPDTGDTDHWTIQVNDFNWLKATPSTNWGTLPPDAHRTLEALQGPPFGC